MKALLVAALLLQIDFEAPGGGRKVRIALPGCHIETVAYRFVGVAGSAFVYGGEIFVMPAKGSIELIAGSGATEYQVSARSLPLNVWPRDEFGIRAVPLPSAPPVSARRSP
jgi:hypothetical protein